MKLRIYEVDCFTFRKLNDVNISLKLIGTRFGFIYMLINAMQTTSSFIDQPLAHSSIANCYLIYFFLHFIAININKFNRYYKSNTNPMIIIVVQWLLESFNDYYSRSLIDDFPLRFSLLDTYFLDSKYLQFDMD